MSEVRLVPQIYLQNFRDRTLVNHGYKYFLTAPRSAVAPAE